MYINFWYPIVRSEDLGYDQPEKAMVLGVNLVERRILLPAAIARISGPLAIVGKKR